MTAPVIPAAAAGQSANLDFTMPDIPTHDPAILLGGQQALLQYRQASRAPRTQNFAVAIAALMARSRNGNSAVPQVLHEAGSGPGLSTLRFQLEICDLVFQKAPQFAPAANTPIYKPFTGTFAAVSPAQNNWRNSFDLQTGISCDAPYSPEYLQNAAYLAEPRTVCPFRDSHTGQCSSPAGLVGPRTCFNPDKRNVGELPGPDSTARPTAKLLTRGIDGNDRVYWVVEPTLEVLLDLLGHPSARVPLYPFMAVLYAGSVAMMASRPVVNPQVFRNDLGLSEDKFYALFDPAENSQWNAQFLGGLPAGAGAVIAPAIPAAVAGGAAGAAVGAAAGPVLPISAYTPNVPSAFRAAAATAADPTQRLRLLEKAVHGHAHALNTLAGILVAKGLQPEEQQSGFDLAVRRPAIAYLFEVKTWRPENLASQIRAGISQLYEYRWRNRDNLGATCHLFLVFDRSPASEFAAVPWLKEYLITDRGIIPCWLEAGALCTYPDVQATLDGILDAA